jgi:5'-AMP-activated protein kinase, catalytic alpha subunit
MFSRSNNKRIKKRYHGAKADIWACGVILYVLLGGYLPFQGKTLMGMYKKICQAELK